MIKYIILGIVQGLTEFLPVSSSGHLVILEKLFGITDNQLAITVILHLGTACALVVYFFKDLLKLFRNLALLALLGTTTVITIVIAVLGNDFFESLFSSVLPIAFALLVTGIILLSTKKFMQGVRSEIRFKDAVILGLTQSIAIIPGISRSGITISTLLFRGIERQKCFYYSFLAAIPVIFGAALFSARKIDFILKAERLNLSIGFLASFLTGLFSLWALKLIMRKAKLHYFGYYCIALALIILLFMR